MKTYHKIPHWNKGIFGQPVIAFDKLDGSNMRFEWSKKRGFHKFGTRTQMITEHAPIYGEGVDMFMEKYSEDLDRIFTDLKDYKHCRKMTVYCEFVGPNSFAGFHDPEDDQDVILFDVDKFQHGILPPKVLLEHFGHLHLPEIVYEGDLTTEFIDSIRNNTDLKEGVVAKGSSKRKGKYYSWMVKIKTNMWLSQVKKDLGQSALLEDLDGNLSLYED